MNEQITDARILVVDDEPKMCRLIETDLRLRGMQS
jgi:DNA-binding response OmpR family regulator